MLWSFKGSKDNSAWRVCLISLGLGNSLTPDLLKISKDTPATIISMNFICVNIWICLHFNQWKAATYQKQIFFIWVCLRNIYHRIAKDITGWRKFIVSIDCPFVRSSLTSIQDFGTFHKDKIDGFSVWCAQLDVSLVNDERWPRNQKFIRDFDYFEYIRLWWFDFCNDQVLPKNDIH